MWCLIRARALKFLNLFHALYQWYYISLSCHILYACGRIPSASWSRNAKSSLVRSRSYLKHQSCLGILHSYDLPVPLGDGSSTNKFDYTENVMSCDSVKSCQSFVTCRPLFLHSQIGANTGFADAALNSTLFERTTAWPPSTRPWTHLRQQRRFSGTIPRPTPSPSLERKAPKTPPLLPRQKMTISLAQ